MQKGQDAGVSIFNPKAVQCSQEEELAVRAMFRSVNYLTLPEELREHVSVSGQVLSTNLVNFCRLASEKHAEFVEKAISHNNTEARDKPAPVKYRSEPVYITLDDETEAHKLENKTCFQLQKLIESELENIPDDDDRNGWMELWGNAIKLKAKKSEYLEFLVEVKDFISLSEDSTTPADTEVQEVM